MFEPGTRIEVVVDSAGTTQRGIFGGLIDWPRNTASVWLDGDDGPSLWDRDAIFAVDLPTRKHG